MQTKASVFAALAVICCLSHGRELPSAWCCQVLDVPETGDTKIQVPSRITPGFDKEDPPYQRDAYSDNLTVDQAMKEALMEYGPLRTAYLHAVLYCQSETLAHYLEPFSVFGYEDGFREINVIGWDDAYPVNNFCSNNAPAGPGAFRCRDVSKGGESGDIWISYYDVSFNYNGAWTYLVTPPHPIPAAEDRVEATGIAVSGDSVTISFMGDPQFSYHLKATDALSPAAWYDFGPTNVGSGLQSFVFPIDERYSQRFFKIETISTP